MTHQSGSLESPVSLFFIICVSKYQLQSWIHHCQQHRTISRQKEPKGGVLSLKLYMDVPAGFWNLDFQYFTPFTLSKTISLKIHPICHILSIFYDNFLKMHPIYEKWVPLLLIHPNLPKSTPKEWHIPGQIETYQWHIQTKHKKSMLYVWFHSNYFIIVFFLLLQFIDVNECSTSPCSVNALCTNLPGTYECACNTGYEGNGINSCTDINECSSADICDTQATCSNTPGSYTCQCNEYHVGDGATCEGRVHNYL